MEGNEDPIYRNRRLAMERKDRWKLCQSQETLIVYVYVNVGGTNQAVRLVANGIVTSRYRVTKFTDKPSFLI